MENMETEADTNPTNVLPTNSSIASNNGHNNGSSGNGARTIKFNPDDLNYDMSGEKYIVIFNHDVYDNTTLAYYGRPQRDRPGSEKDVATLKTTFKKLGFKIDVHHNLTREFIWNTLLELCKKDFSAASCVCVVILTHGYKQGELCAYDKPYYLRHVMQLFENHPTLAGKPKMFFIQACRGDNVDSGDRIDRDGEQKDFFIIPSHADFLLVRSTVEGKADKDYLSYRDCRGSWLIQELCNAIQTYHKDLDILQIITMMHRKVAYDYTTYTPKNKATNEKRQMPETTFTLTKFLKL